jgi:hypothetical protein
MTAQARVASRFELFSPYAPDECAARLGSLVDRSPWMDLSGQPIGGRPMIGRVTAQRFTIAMRPKRDPVTQRLRRNSFKPHLRATIEAIPGGSRIAGKTGLHPFVLGFLGLWFFGVTTLGGLMMFVAFRTIHFDPRELYRLQWFLVAFPVALLAFGGLLLHWGRVLAEGEADELMSFVRMILDARTTRG